VETRNFFYAVHTMPPYASYRMVTSRAKGDVTISEEVPSDPTRPYPTLTYPKLTYPTLPYPTLPYPTLPYPTLP